MPSEAVLAQLRFGLETFRRFDDRAKDMGRDRANAGKTLKFAHFPEGFADPFHFLERFFPLRDRLIVLPVESLHHAPFFVPRQLARDNRAERFWKTLSAHGA